MWFNILKSEKPQWSAFFSEMSRYNIEELADKYNIPKNAELLIRQSQLGKKPIRNIKSYNAAVKEKKDKAKKTFEAKQKERMNRPRRKKGQDPKRKKQQRQKKTRSQRQASAQHVRDKEMRRDRAARDEEQRRLRNERRGL